MSLLLFSNDLMFQSRIASVARGLGQSLVVARTTDGLSDRVSEADPPAMAVFDLAFRGLNLDEAVAWVAQRFPQCATVAYGPHVDTDALQKAESLGVQRVLTRGQFDRDMHAVLSSGIAPDAIPRS